MGKIIGNIVVTVSILFMLWIATSWVEVVAKNATENPTYSKSNLFVLLVGEDEGKID